MSTSDVVQFVLLPYCLYRLRVITLAWDAGLREEPAVEEIK